MSFIVVSNEYIYNKYSLRIASNMGIEIYLNEKCNLSNKNFIICLFLFNQIIIFHTAKKGMKKFFLCMFMGTEWKEFGQFVKCESCRKKLHRIKMREKKE